MHDKPDDSALQSALAPLFPPDHLKVVGFLIPSDRMTDELVQWYETEHSINARFQWPHMSLYQRNFIMETERGDPPIYKVITEFVWKSEEDKQKARALYGTDAAAKTMNEVLPPFILQPFPADGYFMVPVESRVVRAGSGLPRPDEPRPRKILLLRRAAGVSRGIFEAMAFAYAEKVAEGESQAAVQVDLRRGGEDVSSPADAVIFIDAGSDSELPPPESDAFDIVKVFGVKTLRSPLPGS
ncbi:MAG TPA: hypothetical protein VJQ77_01470 [Novosphingobium sp.]|nr:hypothetical protein [Novosphingobium sp.]